MMKFEKIQLFEMADPEPVKQRKLEKAERSKHVKNHGSVKELVFDIAPFLPILQHYKAYVIQPYVNQIDECYIAQITLHPKKWLDHCREIDKPSENYITLLKDNKSLVMARVPLDMIGEKVFFTRKEAEEGMKQYRKKYAIRFDIEESEGQK